MSRVLKELESRTNVQHLGSFDRSSRTYFYQSTWNLAPLDYVSCNLTDFELNPNEVRDDLTELGVNLDKPLAVFHPTPNSPVTELYYATMYPEPINGTVYVHVMISPQIKSDHIHHLKTDPLSNVNKSGIAVNLEAVGGDLDAIFRTILSYH